MGAVFAAMTLKEKMLFHQIHPLKLAIDGLAAAFSLYFFWQHQLLAGLILHFLPPILASFLLVRYAALEPYQQSSFGRYVARHMTRIMEWLRLFGDIVMVLGAWAHDVSLLLLGLAVIVGAWCNGLITPKRAPK
jgi:hypothetical protein